MVDYRAHGAGDDGHFTNLVAFVCADDSDAIEWASS
jgi:hypothetical protein